MIAGIEKAVEVADKVQKSFWDKWREIIKDFPDIEESDAVQMVALQVALLSLTGNYLLGYEKKVRMFYFEHFIEGLRMLENQIKNED